MSEGGPAFVRPARPADLARVAEVYNQGIEGREATFETRPREPAELVEWLVHGLPFLVAELDGRIVGFARVSPYSDRCVYEGIGEHGVYVDVAAQGRRIGVQLLEALSERAEAAGLYKLTSRIITTNTASRAAHRAAGFDEVGIQRRHGRIDGRWRDTVLVERLLGEAATDPP